MREQLMLYVPWKDEEKELIDANIRKVFEEKAEIIKSNKRAFVFYSNNESFIDDVQKDINIRDKNNNYNDSEETLDDDQPEEIDILEIVENSTKPKTSIERFPNQDRPTKQQYVELLSMLNEKQKKYLLHLMYKIKMSERPFFEFISGSAGTGKSLFIKAIFISVNEYFAKQPGGNPKEVIFNY